MVESSSQQSVEGVPGRPNARITAWVACALCALAAVACSSSSREAKAFGDIPVARGTVPPVSSVSSTWHSYESPTIGLGFRFPDDWQVAECSAGDGVCVHPLGSGTDPLRPEISFEVFSDRPYGSSASLPDMTPPRSIVVAGLSGRESESASYAIPTEGHVIELPYRGGTLYISAPIGPRVDLVPQLTELLKTVLLQG
jgi:hypothetical protein